MAAILHKAHLPQAHGRTLFSFTCCFNRQPWLPAPLEYDALALDSLWDARVPAPFYSSSARVRQRTERINRACESRVHIRNHPPFMTQNSLLTFIFFTYKKNLVPFARPSVKTQQALTRWLRIQVTVQKKNWSAS